MIDDLTPADHFIIKLSLSPEHESTVVEISRQLANYVFSTRGVLSVCGGYAILQGEIRSANSVVMPMMNFENQRMPCVLVEVEFKH